jgi:ribosomal protein S18 acetylase RimI-like enzyme
MPPFDQFSIRRLMAADPTAAAADLLFAFFREEGFPGSRETIEAHTREMLRLDVCAVFLAEQGEIAVGIATVSLEFGIEYGWSAEMGDLYIAPDWRGRGVARRLTAAVEAYLQDRGIAGYQVTVAPTGEARDRLGAFYRRLGFKDEGRGILWRSLGD